MKTLLPFLCLSLQASSTDSFSGSTAAHRGATSTGRQRHSYVGSPQRLMARGSPLWVSQMRGESSLNNLNPDGKDQGNDPTLQMLQQNQMRAKRLMTQGRLIRDQIEESPFKMSFIWLSDQLIALTSHLRDRYEVLQYYALRREEDRLELTQRNIEMFEWVESELAEVESQLEDYGRLVASSLRGNPEDDTLQAELRELSMLSQDMQEQMGDQLPSERDVKYQELKRAYEKAQISLGRLNQLRHELYAVEEALDELEGPCFMNLENDRNGPYSTTSETASAPPPPVEYPSDREGSQNAVSNPISKIANTWEGLTTFPYERSQPSTKPSQDNRGMDFTGNGAAETWRGPYVEPEQGLYERAVSSEAREYNPESWDNFVRFWGDFTSPNDDNSASVERMSSADINEEAERSDEGTDLPNHYEAVAEWASKQPSRTSVEQVMFQLRNQRVAMETVSTGSSTRWGDMEVSRAVAFAEMVWDTLDKKFPDTIQSSIPADSRQVDEKDDMSSQKESYEWLGSNENASEEAIIRPLRQPHKNPFDPEESKKRFSKTSDTTRQSNDQTSNTNALKPGATSQMFESGNTSIPSTPWTTLNGIVSEREGTTGSMSYPTANDVTKQRIEQKAGNRDSWSPAWATSRTKENAKRDYNPSFQTSAKSIMDSPVRVPESTTKTAARSFSAATSDSSSPKPFSQKKSSQEVRKISIKFPRKEEMKPPAETETNHKSEVSQAANTKSSQQETPVEASSDTRVKTPWGSMGSSSSSKLDKSFEKSSERTFSSNSNFLPTDKSGDGANPPPFNTSWNSPANQAKANKKETWQTQPTGVGAGTPWGSLAGSPAKMDKDLPEKPFHQAASVGNNLSQLEEKSGDGANPPAFSTPWTKAGEEGAPSPRTVTGSPWTSSGTRPVNMERKDTKMSPPNSSDNGLSLGNAKLRAEEKSGDGNPPAFNLPWKSPGNEFKTEKKDEMFSQNFAARSSTSSSSRGSPEEKKSWSPHVFSKDGQVPTSSSPWNSLGGAVSKIAKKDAWSPQRNTDLLKKPITDTSLNPNGASVSKLDKKVSLSPLKPAETSANKVGKAPWNSFGTLPTNSIKKEPWSPPKGADKATKTSVAGPWGSPGKSPPEVDITASWNLQKNTESTKNSASNMDKKVAWSPKKNTEVSNGIEAISSSAPWANIERKGTTKASHTQGASLPWKSSGTASAKTENDDKSPRAPAGQQNRLDNASNVTWSDQQGSEPMTAGDVVWKNPTISSSSTKNRTPWSQQNSKGNSMSDSTGPAPGSAVWAVSRSSPSKVERKAPWSPQKNPGSATFFTDSASWNAPGAISSVRKQGGWSPQMSKEKFSAARSPWNAPESKTDVKKPAWSSSKSTISSWNNSGIVEAKQDQTGTWETSNTNNSAGVSAKSAAPGTSPRTSGSPGINPNFGMRTQQLGAEEIDVYGPVSSREKRPSSGLQQKTPWPPQQIISDAPVSQPWNDIGEPKTMKSAWSSKRSIDKSPWKESGSSSAKAEKDVISFMPKMKTEEKKERSPGIVDGFGRFTHELGVNGGVLDSSYEDIPSPKMDLSARSPGINPNFGMRTQQLGAEEIDVYGVVSKSSTSPQNDSRSHSKISPDFGRFSQQLGAQEMGPSRTLAGKRTGQPRPPSSAFTSDQGRFTPQLIDKDIGPRQGSPVRREEVAIKPGGAFSMSPGGGWFSQFSKTETRSSQTPIDRQRFSRQNENETASTSTGASSQFNQKDKRESSTFPSDRGSVSPQFSKDETGPSWSPFQLANKQGPLDKAGGGFSTVQAGNFFPFGEKKIEQAHGTPTNEEEKLRPTESAFLSDHGGSNSFASPPQIGMVPNPSQTQKQGSSTQSASGQNQSHQSRDVNVSDKYSSENSSSRNQHPSPNNPQNRRQAGSAFTSDQGRFTPQLGKEDTVWGQREHMSGPQRSRQTRGAFTSDQGRFSPHLVDEDIGPKKRTPPKRIGQLNNSNGGGETWDAPQRGSAWSRSSASMPPPKGKILSPDQLARDWGPNDGPRPTELYRGRTQRVASSAVAEKSRWGRMENEKAMFMTNTPAPWDTSTAKPQKPQWLRDQTSSNSSPNVGDFGNPVERSFPSDTQDFGTRNYAEQPKKVHRYRPRVEPMAPGYSQPSAASNAPRGYTPLAPDTLVKEWGIQGALGSRGLYDSRSHKVAASAASGRSRWGAMENQRAFHVAGTENMVPKPPDNIFDRRTRNTGGDPRLVNDHVEHRTSWRPSASDEHFSRSYQTFAPPPAENRFRNADWNHQANDWRDDNPYHARSEEDFNEDQRWHQG